MTYLKGLSDSKKDCCGSLVIPLSSFQDFPCGLCFSFSFSFHSFSFSEFVFLIQCQLHKMISHICFQLHICLKLQISVHLHRLSPLSVPPPFSILLLFLPLSLLLILSRLPQDFILFPRLILKPQTPAVFLSQPPKELVL